MQALLRPRRLGAILAAFAAVALVIAGAASGLTSKSFTYKSPKTGYVIVSSMGFAPSDDSRVYNNSNTAGLSTNGGCFTAALALPAGAKVKSLQVFYKSTTGNILGQITRTSLANGTMTAIASVQPTDTSATFRSSTAGVAAAHQKVSASFAYGLQLCEGPGDTFHAAKVKYTYTSAGS
jgi:hypothetical protein